MGARTAGRHGSADADDDDAADTGKGRRPVWSGSISFGMVNIAVRMFPAVRSHDVHFHQISRSGRKRIRYLKVAEGETEAVPADDIVKGYRITNGSYVTFEAQELERIAARKSRMIDIEAFVALSEIDPRLFNRPYYLLPADEQAAKPYHLLVEALKRSDRVGIAQMVMHNKEHLVAVRSIADTLSLETLYFSDEIIDPHDLRRARKRPALGTRELTMADQLVASLSSSFSASAYRDTYQERLRSAIKRKAKGKTLLLDEPEDEVDDGKVLDLMEALRRSVDRSGSARNRKQRATPRGRRRRKAG